MYKLLICLFLLQIQIVKAQVFKKEVLKSSANTLVSKIDIDIDFDGDLDHFALNENEDILIFYKNFNDEYFTEEVIFDSPNNVTAYNIADLDNDGKTEIVIVTNKETEIGKYSNSEFTFQKLPTSIGYNLSVTQLNIEDMNGDGLKDLICIPSYNHIMIFYNDNEMSFKLKTTLSSISNDHPSQFIVMDFDFDGLVDVFYYTGKRKFGYFKNNGNSTYINTALGAFPDGHGRLKLTDFDSDGLMDIVLIYITIPTIAGITGTSQIYLFTAKNQYKVAQSLTHVMDGIYDYTIADIDFDQDKDIVCSHYRRREGSGGYYIEMEQTELHINDGQLKFDIKVINQEKNQTNRNFNLIKSIDGKDIISFVSYGGDYIGHYLDYLSSAVKVNKINTDFPFDIDDYSYFDIDNDGIKDIITTNRGPLFKYPFLLYKGKGRNTYQKSLVKSNEPRLMSKILFTSENEANTDLITSDGRSLVIHTFVTLDSTSAKVLKEGIIVTGNKVFDFDNDGDLDIIIYADNNLYANDKGYHLTLFVQDQKGDFEMLHLQEKIQAKHVELVDINNDGLMDILSSESKDFVPFGQTNPTLLYEYINKGNNQFERKVHASNISSDFFKLIDLDKDGDLDIISLNTNRNKLSLYEKKRNNNYTETKISDLDFNGIADPKIFDLIDMNNDGREDVIMYQNKTYIFHNLGSLQFKKSTINEETNKINAGGFETPMYLLDLDQDNDYDLIRVNKDKYLEFLYNQNDKSQIVVIGYYDKNENGTLDTTEYTYNDFFVSLSPQKDTYLSKKDDKTIFYVDKNKYTLRYELNYNNAWELLSKDTFNIEINSKSTDTFFFALKPRKLEKKINANITSTITRCNQPAIVTVDILNTGTEEINATFDLEIDNRINYISYFQDVDTVYNNKKVGWKLNNFYPGRTISKKIEVRIPGITPNLNPGDILQFSGKIKSVMGDSISGTSTIEYKPVLRCSYDPNDKLVLPDNPNGQILEDQDLTYTIRFQNTGNDTAFVVVIEDTISNMLDINSLRVISSSHPENLKINYQRDNVIRFEFANVYLPDSTTNFIKSQGYVTFIISPKYNELSIGDSIFNTAYIYFDFNPAIVTNTTKNVLSENISSIFETIDLDSNLFYPNPSSQWIDINTDIFDIDQIIIYNNLGNIEKSIDLNDQRILDIEFLKSGIYYVAALKDKNIFKIQKLIKI